MTTCERCEEPTRHLTRVTYLYPRPLNGDVPPLPRERSLCVLCLRDQANHVDVNDAREERRWEDVR